MYNEGRLVQLGQAKRRSRFDTFSSGGSITSAASAAATPLREK